MKKTIISIILICLISSCAFCACEDDYDKAGDPTRNLSLVRIARQDDQEAEGMIDRIEYYYHKDTGVVYMYVVYLGGNGTSGGITPLYKADGTLMTYDEFTLD